MNAAIRAVVRTAISKGHQVLGIYGGYSGMLEQRAEELFLRSVANIIQRGGTVLKTGRCAEFMHAEYRTKAAAFLKSQNVTGLVCIGGDGSFRGATALYKEHGIPTVGVPGTIDNDVFGTDLTIGFDTAINTAVDAIDRIRDTATSHERVFIVEVMGRNSGHIAVNVGLAGGAEEIFTPEFPMALDKVVEKLKNSQSRGKKTSIIITAEGQKPGRAYDLAEQLRKRAGIEAKVCILGHTLRGGTPTVGDRVLASRMGSAAVECLQLGHHGVMIGVMKNQLIRVPLEQVAAGQNQLSKEYLELASILAN
jgi:6-phosphofructokinase 1